MEMNTFLNSLKSQTNYKTTENGAIAHKSTLSKVYDMFAFGGAYRNRRHNDVVLLFKQAYEENPVLALKCLFYLRDIRGGQGERRFFRIAYQWLCSYDREKAKELAKYVTEYGRWDDLIYTTYGTPVWDTCINIIKTQLMEDIKSDAPSLLAKWMPSENASSIATKKIAKAIRVELGLTSREYRKTLSGLRKKINIVERLMSENRWEEIEFDSIPSRAGIIYSDAFSRRDIIMDKYKEFINSEKTTVNADTLYPYDIVRKALDMRWRNTDRKVIDKYWNSLPDYTEGKESKIMCVVDTSGSMTWAWESKKNVRPIDVAIGLGVYCAERLKGPFKDKYISFSSRPQFIEIDGVDMVDKFERIYDTNLVDNTDLEAVFDLMLEAALISKSENLPETILIISDMEIDAGTTHYSLNNDRIRTIMEEIRIDWERAGIKMPRLVYWNVDARNNTVLDLSEDVSLVSGASPSILKQIMTGKTGYDLMLETLNSERYMNIK